VFKKPEIKSEKMYRIAIKELIKWKLNKNKKPLVFLGVRQVGKTWHKYSPRRIVSSRESRICHALPAQFYRIFIGYGGNRSRWDNGKTWLGIS